MSFIQSEVFYLFLIGIAIIIINTIFYKLGYTINPKWSLMRPDQDMFDDKRDNPLASLVIFILIYIMGIMSIITSLLLYFIL